MEPRDYNEDELIMYFILNTDLVMSSGKKCAQVAHAATVLCVQATGSEPFDSWYKGEMKKIVLGATEEKMRSLRALHPSLIPIHDAGYTEVAPNSLTVLGLPVMTRAQAAPILKRLQTLKDPL